MTEAELVEQGQMARNNYVTTFGITITIISEDQFINRIIEESTWSG
jgi:hypothetical protein